jgi:hypothetical protein
LAGPLRAYAATSSVGTALRFRDFTVVPVSTAFHQPLLRSAGAIASTELEALGRIAADPALRSRPLVFAQHHPPGRHFVPLFQWVDGLAEHSTFSALFERCPYLHVVHGHTHHEVNRSVKQGEAARIFSAKAVVESESSLRLYDAAPHGLSPLEVPMPLPMATTSQLPHRCLA